MEAAITYQMSSLKKRHSQADDWAFQYSQAKAITMIGFTLCNI